MFEYFFNSNEPLVIVDGTDFGGETNANTLFWSSVDVPCGCISVPLVVDQNGKSLKKRYIALINEISNRKVNGVSVKEQLTVSGFSFWWSSLISEKSCWKTKNIYVSFKYFILHDMLISYSGDQILIFSDDEQLISLVFSSIKNTKIKIVHSKKPSLKKRAQRFIPNSLKAIAYWLRSFYQYRSAIFRSSPENKKRLENKLNMIGYSLGLSIDKIKEGTVCSNYWTGIQSITQHRGVNWLLLYVPSKEFPSLKKLLTYRDAFLKESNHNLVILEEFYSPRVAVHALFIYLRLAFRARCLAKVFEASKSEKLLFQSDWNCSFKGAAAMSSCIKYALLIRAITKLNYGVSKSFYVYENQPWEIMLLHCWRQLSDSPIFGFQHVSGKYYDLRPFNSNCLDKPDKLIVTGETAKQELLEFGYDENKIYVAESIRNLYLSKYSNKNKACVENKSEVLLVITDYLYDISDFQLKLLADAWGNISNKFHRIIIKPHPACEINSILKRYSLLDDPKIEVVSTELAQLWSKCSVVYTSNITGASLESAYIGLPTIVSLALDGFNMSPLRGIENVSFVASKRDMEMAIYITSVPNIEFNFSSFNTSVPNWREILNESSAVGQPSLK